MHIIGIMGSGTKSYSPLDEDAGRVVGEIGCHLLTGGGGGVMEAAAKAFINTPGRKGLSIGIIRARDWKHLGGKPEPTVDHTPYQHNPYSHRLYTLGKVNPYVEIKITTHLPESDTTLASRNHINALTPKGIVVLPGNGGTASEFQLAVEYGTPIVLYIGNGTVGGRNAQELQRLGKGIQIANNTDALRDCLEAIPKPT